MDGVLVAPGDDWPFERVELETEALGPSGTRRGSACHPSAVKRENRRTCGFEVYRNKGPVAAQIATATVAIEKATVLPVQRVTA